MPGFQSQMKSGWCSFTGHGLIMMVKMSGLQIRKPISEKLTLQIYRNNQNKNYSLYGQGIHSKDLIKIWKVGDQKAWKEQSIRRHGLCFLQDKGIYGSLTHGKTTWPGGKDPASRLGSAFSNSGPWMSQKNHQAGGCLLQRDEVGPSARRHPPAPPVPALPNAITKAFLTSEPLSQKELSSRLGVCA